MQSITVGCTHPPVCTTRKHLYNSHQPLNTPLSSLATIDKNVRLPYVLIDINVLSLVYLIITRINYKM